MVEKRTIGFCVCLLAPLLLGMGMFGQPAARQKVPETHQRFDATVVDQEGVVVHVTHMSYDGELYLPVFQGKGLVTVPFGKIRKIEIGMAQAEVSYGRCDGGDAGFWISLCDCR